MSWKIGDKFRINNENGQYTRWANKTWIVNDVAYSGRGYDTGMNGQALLSAKGLPVSVYECEVTKLYHNPILGR